MATSPSLSSPLHYERQVALPVPGSLPVNEHLARTVLAGTEDQYIKVVLRRSGRKRGRKKVYILLSAHDNRWAHTSPNLEAIVNVIIAARNEGRDPTQCFRLMDPEE